MAKDYIEKLPTTHVVPPEHMARKINELIERSGFAKPEDKEDAGRTAPGSFKAGPVDNKAPSPLTAHNQSEVAAPAGTLK